MTTVFVYGTLMHPKILKWVLNNDASHLQIRPAILTDYTRYKAKSADFPAILPAERSKSLLGRELTAEENSVRGMLVAGLTAEDIAALDELEGNHDMYERLRVLVHPLGQFAPIPADAATANSETGMKSHPDCSSPNRDVDEQTQPMETQTYAWCLEDSKLEKELWSFDEYLRNNAWRWI